ncbi:hypothetical protein [Bradyrhizobium sp.]|uniref:hypothetical protein n=1 Tax=Bradyrhizobium sp. TaxID=376 RepID=UPI0039E3A08F
MRDELRVAAWLFNLRSAPGMLRRLRWAGKWNWFGDDPDISSVSAGSIIARRQAAAFIRVADELSSDANASASLTGCSAACSRDHLLRRLEAASGNAVGIFEARDARSSPPAHCCPVGARTINQIPADQYCTESNVIIVPSIVLDHIPVKQQIVPGMPRQERNDDDAPQLPRAISGIPRIDLRIALRTAPSVFQAPGRGTPQDLVMQRATRGWASRTCGGLLAVTALKLLGACLGCYPT